MRGNADKQSKGKAMNKRGIVVTVSMLALIACSKYGNATTNADSVVFSVADRQTQQLPLVSAQCRITANILNNSNEHLSELGFWLKYGDFWHQDRVGNVARGKNLTFQFNLNASCENLPEPKLDVFECRLSSGPPTADVSKITYRDCPKPVVFRPGGPR